MPKIVCFQQSSHLKIKYILECAAYGIFDVLHIRRSRQQVCHADHRAAFEPAANDAIQIAHIGVHVQREAMPRHAFRIDLHAAGRDLRRFLPVFGSATRAARGDIGLYPDAR